MMRKRMVKRMQWLLETALLVAVSFPIALLPRNAAVKVGEVLGLLLFRLWGSRRAVAVDNILRAQQEGALDSGAQAGEVARQSFVNVGRSFAEVLQIYFGRGRAIVAGAELRGLEHYRKAQEKGRGVIVITGHYGNWELMALAFGVKTGKVSVVARRQNNPVLNALIERVRARYGNAVIYKQGALKQILGLLRKGGTVGILMDQAVLSDEGFVVPFLGRGAWTTRMPSLLARKTGAPVVPVFIRRTGGGHVITIYPEIPLSTNERAEEALIEDTERFSAAIEAVIRRDPREWLWIHRRWKRTGSSAVQQSMAQP